MWDGIFNLRGLMLFLVDSVSVSGIVGFLVGVVVSVGVGIFRFRVSRVGGGEWRGDMGSFF